MTDKQIIIDGVPVQDCCYFDYENDGYEDSCYIHQNECSAQNCYYKQLKRSEAQCEAMFVTHTDLEKAFKAKEQECEELKENLPNAITRLMGELDQLKAENDELKRQYKELGQCSKGLKDYFEKEKETLSNRFLKLKQTLTEIKEIVSSTLDCGEWIGQGDNKMEQILNKISEVENEN